MSTLAYFWTPLLSEPYSQALTSTIAKIANDPGDTELERSDLANGLAGIALFYGYLAKSHPTGPWANRCQELLSRSIEANYPVERELSFLHGRIGAAWAVSHLRAILPAGFQASALDAADKLVHARLERSPWCGVHDVADGLAGLGVYALEDPSRPLARSIVERTIVLLEESALPSQAGVAWWTPPHNLSPERRAVYPQGYFNLGAAHGMPSIISYLAKVCAAGISERRARRLLERAMSWLLAQQVSDLPDFRFPALIPLNKRPIRPRRPRLAWCYGDLGIGGALHGAATSVRMTGWSEAALMIARIAADRSIDDSGVDDNSLCHGALGNAHLFNRLYQRTHEETFKRAARLWFEYGLKAYTTLPTIDEEGAERPSGKAFEGQPKERGLFGGLAGIGLVLLAATTAIVPEWDKVMSIA